MQAELQREGRPAETVIEHWLEDEDRWDDDPPAPDSEQELLDYGLCAVGGARQLWVAQGGPRARAAARG